jgi:isopropylmalate/homocitrate/citramalate synthase
MSQARKARRELAKSLGYLKKDESMQSFMERVKRSHEMGKHFHTLHLQNVMNQQLEAEKIKSEKGLENFIKEENKTEENFGINTDSFDFLDEFKPEGSSKIEIPDNPK